MTLVRSNALLAALSLTAAAGAEVRFVNANLSTGANDGSAWANAFQGRLGVQLALAASNAGDEIWVAEGTYAPAPPLGNVHATIRLKIGVRLLGGFAGNESQSEHRDPVSHLSVLTGDLDSDGNDNFPPDNSYHVVSAINVDASTVLDGFVISDGIAGQDDLVPFAGGGCILILDGSGPTVRHCRISDGFAGFGGGVYVARAAPLFENCTFTRSVADFGANFFQTDGANTTINNCRFVGQSLISSGGAGVGIYSGPIFGAEASVLTVHDCDFSIVEEGGSSSEGVAICIDGDRADITNSRFRDNRSAGHGACGIRAGADVRFDRCVFIGNEGRSDGGAVIAAHKSTVTMTNSLITGNDREGFTTILVSGSLTMTNCTIVANGSTDNAHSVFILGVGPHTIRNSVIWNNLTVAGEEDVVLNEFSTNVTFDRCIVQGWNGSLDGDDTFSADPHFADPLGTDGLPGTPDDDYSLLDNSPAIDRGSNTFAAGLTIDLASNPRFTDNPATPDTGEGAAPIIDLGALEWQNPCQADFDADGFITGADFDLYVQAFEAGETIADFDGDGFVSGIDFDLYVAAFEAGC